MGLSEKLVLIKNGIVALLNHANQTTGAGDTDLGAAVQTLIDGYGQGGTNVLQTITWTNSTTRSNTAQQTLASWALDFDIRDHNIAIAAKFTDVESGDNAYIEAAAQVCMHGGRYLSSNLEVSDGGTYVGHNTIGIILDPIASSNILAFKFRYNADYCPKLYPCTAKITVYEI